MKGGESGEKIAEKKGYVFYRSYYDILNCLDDASYVQLSKAIHAVMFFDADIEAIKFENPMLNISWVSIKHSLKQSINGFLSKNKLQYGDILKNAANPYEPLSHPPCQGGYQGGAEPPYQAPTQAPCPQGEGEGQEKGKGEEEGQEQGQVQGQQGHSGRVRKKPRTSTAPTWAAYSQAYYQRYGVEPVRNATVNSQIVNFVKRLGKDDAPHVAAFYLLSNDQWHIKQRHSVGDMCKSAESLHTAWRMGRHTTTTQARQQDRSQANFNAFDGLLQEAGHGK